jgi:hypothetical protein
LRAIGIGAATIAAIVVAGCGKGSGTPGAPTVAGAKPAGIKPGEEASLMPLTEGSQWTYVIEESLSNQQSNAQGSSLLTYRVAKSEKTPEGIKATLEVIVDNKVRNRQLFLMKSDGLYELAAGLDLKPFPTPQIVIPFPPDPGRKFKWRGPGMIAPKKPGLVKVTGEILGTQEPDTSAGKFSAITVRQNSEPAEGEKSFVRETTSWYAPNVGLVRFWDESLEKDGTARRTTLKLKTYSLKK